MCARTNDSRDSRHYSDWLDYSHDDLVAAKVLRENPQCANAAAFHCQQCIEKVLKAYILYRTGQSVDGQNLTWLCKKAAKLNGDFSQWLDESAYLNRYYIQTRYPSDNPQDISQKQLDRAYTMANDMFYMIQAEL